MELEEIKLDTVDKMFEFEKHSRFIDQLNVEELKKFSKLYCKLYLKQQEVIVQLNNI